MPALAARQLYWVVYGLAAAALAWLIVTGALAANDRESAPERALRWRSDDPGAQRRLAELALEAGKPDAARGHALSALVRSPHDATLYRLLGEAARANANDALARRLFASAGRFTHRDAALAATFFEDAVREARWDEAMTQAQVLIRRSPRSESAVLFRLATLAREPAFAAVLGKALAQEPEWRAAFFRELGGSGAHVPATLLIVESVRAAGGEVKSAEISRVLLRMLEGGQAADARSLWLAGLPTTDRPAAGEVYDPTFNDAEAGGPFGWTVGEHTRSDVAFANPGLRIERNGIDAERLARQRLILPPGQYELESTGRWQSGDPLSLRWQIGCPGAPPIALDLAGPNRVVARGAFEVSPACPVQNLFLSAAGRDRDTPASGLVESVRIRRLG